MLPQCTMACTHHKAACTPLLLWTQLCSSCFDALGFLLLVLFLVLPLCWRSLHHTEVAAALFRLACCCRLILLVDDFCKLLRGLQSTSYRSQVLMRAECTSKGLDMSH